MQSIQPSINSLAFTISSAYFIGCLTGVGNWYRMLQQQLYALVIPATLTKIKVAHRLGRLADSESVQSNGSESH